MASRRSTVPDPPDPHPRRVSQLCRSPPPPLLELQLRLNFLRRLTFFTHSFDFFALQPSNEGDTNCLVTTADDDATLWT